MPIMFCWLVAKLKCTIKYAIYLKLHCMFIKIFIDNMVYANTYKIKSTYAIDGNSSTIRQRELLLHFLPLFIRNHAHQFYHEEVE